MKTRTREFIQHLSHEIDDEDKAAEYLDESLPLIGLVVMYFNALEKSLDSSICESISDRSDAYGLIVIQKLSYAAKVDLLKRFGDDLHSSFAASIDGFSDLVAALAEVGRLRNLVVHADWENTDHEGYTFVRMRTSEKEMKQEYVQFSPASLEKLIARMLEVREMLSDYWARRVALLRRKMTAVVWLCRLV